LWLNPIVTVESQESEGQGVKHPVTEKFLRLLKAAIATISSAIGIAH